MLLNLAYLAGTFSEKITVFISKACHGPGYDLLVRILLTSDITQFHILLAVGQSQNGAVLIPARGEGKRQQSPLNSVLIL
jgi:hypothetical protein